MRKIIYILVFTLGVCGYYAIACASTPNEPDTPPPRAEIRTLPELKNAYGIDLSVYIYKRTLDQYAGKTTELAKVIVDFGFTDVYLNFGRCQIPCDPDLANYIRKLISALSAHQIKVHALAFTEINPIGDEQQETLEVLADFQAASAPNERFAGINFDIEPHIMRQNRDNWKKVSDKYGLQHIDWQSDNGYGKDGVNSKVMQFVLDQIGQIRQKTVDNNYIYSQALGHFFEDRYQDGNLSAGSVNDFLEVCDHVIIMNYTDDTNRLIKFSMAEFTNANKPGSVEIAVKTADNGVGDLSTTFADEDWDTMMEALVALCEAAKPYSTFKGVSIFELQSFEELWKERNHNK
ncbi:hypothetical protein [Proteiniphilum sp. UBA5384]|uniref:hypothetical protein n=1 Tax=Proteiniphilum sp. UBA5384 TaxID=1947279 RepID=UPI00260043C2|nr:hypothetical protein [Proteiniphilum sp. UBA5384]